MLSEIIRTIIAVVILFIFAGCESRAEEKIKIVLPMQKQISSFENAFLEVRDIDAEDVAGFGGSEDGYVIAEISLSLNGFGLQWGLDADAADIKVMCRYERKWLPPIIGRHLNIHLRHIGYINIQLTDMESGQVVGEVEFNRPRWASPEAGTIPHMFAELLKSPPPSRTPGGESQ